VKPLTPKQLIELLPAGTLDLRPALKAFDDFAPLEFRSPGFLREAISEGWTTPQLVNVSGVPAYLLTYHLSTDGGLWIDVAQTLDADAPYAALIAGVDLLAQKHRAKYTRFLTKRRGIATVMQEHGFFPESVMMTKGGVA